MRLARLPHLASTCNNNELSGRFGARFQRLGPNSVDIAQQSAEARQHWTHPGQICTPQDQVLNSQRTRPTLVWTPFHKGTSVWPNLWQSRTGLARVSPKLPQHGGHWGGVEQRWVDSTNPVGCRIQNVILYGPPIEQHVACQVARHHSGSLREWPRPASPKRTFLLCFTSASHPEYGGNEGGAVPDPVVIFPPNIGRSLVNFGRTWRELATGRPNWGEIGQMWPGLGRTSPVSAKHPHLAY